MFLYRELIFAHSIVRWLVLILLLLSIMLAMRGLIGKRAFTINKLRHWTATAAHIQLMIGIVLYVKSPFVKTFFFGVFHITMMLCAIVVLTVGSAMAKRATTDHRKYKTMLLWYGIALLLIMVAIPWVSRPLLRTY